MEVLEDRRLLAFSVINQPTAAYESSTTNIPIAVSDGTNVNSLADAKETVSFDTTMTAATVPTTWGTWGSPPNTETATPRVLFNSSANTITLTLSAPTTQFGVEMEPDSGTDTMTATFFDGATQVGAINRGSISSISGALLFAATTSPDSPFTKVVLSNNDNNHDGIGIAQVRYAMPSPLVLNGTAGNDTIRLAIDGSNPGQLDVYFNGNTGTPDATYSLASLSQIDVNGGTGDDNLTVDSTNGPITVPIEYDGGTGQNTLTFKGGAATGDVYSPGPGVGAGRNQLTFAGGVETVDFTDLTPVSDLVAGPLTVDGTNGNDAITAGASPNLVSVNNLETITFANKTRLTLNGQAGDDTFNITPTNITLTGGAQSIIVNGTAGANDTVTVNGRMQVVGKPPDAIDYSPQFLPGIGTVTVANAPLVFMSNIAGLAINGQAGNEALTVTTVSGLDQDTLTAGSAIDSGNVTITSFQAPASDIPLSYSNLGAGGSLTFQDASGARQDSLVYDGTAANDAFTVDAGTGTVHLEAGDNNVSQIPVLTPGVTNLVLNGLAGDNTYTIGADSPYADGIDVNGSGLADPDVLNLVGDGTPVTVNMGTPTPTLSGGGLGTVAIPLSISGVGTVNLNDGAGAITVNGSAGPDTFNVTPTGTNSATVMANGVAPTLNLTAASLLIADTTSPAGNTVVVNGTAATDVIGVVRGATTTVMVNDGTPLLPVSMTTLDTTALTVASDTGADTINVSGSGGPTVFTVLGGQSPASATLNVTDTAAGTTTVTPGATNDSGTLVNGDGTVNFAGVKSVKVTGTGADTLVVKGTNGNDAITAQTVGAVPGTNVAWVNAQAPIAFSRFATLDLDGMPPTGSFGNDTVTVSPAGLNVNGVTTINVSGTPGANDQVTVNGAASDALDYSPSGPAAGKVTVGAATVNITNFAGLSINGQAGNNPLTVTTLAPSTATLTPGATPDSGGLVVGSLLPLSYLNLGAASLTVADPGGTLVYNGTTANDAFTVDPGTGTIHLDSQIPVLTPGVSTLTLNGLAGDNTYNVTATVANPLPYTTININGSGLADPDVLNLNGDGTAMIVNMGTATPTVTGGGLGTVDVSGVGTINLNDGAGTIMVDGTPGPDGFNVTPTGANSAMIQANGVAPVLNVTTTTGTLTSIRGWVATTRSPSTARRIPTRSPPRLAPSRR